jgi:uncharacterized repeat protein (TIGR01451 family)
VPEPAPETAAKEQFPPMRDTEGGPGAAPLLEMKKTAPGLLTIGKAFPYDIVIRNLGQAAATLLTVEDELPAWVQLVQAEPQPEVKDKRLTWKLDKLDPLKDWRIRVEVIPVQKGKFTGGPFITYGTGVTWLKDGEQAAPAGGPAPPRLALPVRQPVSPPLTPPVQTPIPPPQAPPVPEPIPPPLAAGEHDSDQPPVKLTMTGPESAAVGGPVVFKIEVTNNGTAPVSNLVLHDQLPSGLRHPQGDRIEADLGTLAPQKTRKLTLATTAVQAGRQVNKTMIVLGKKVLGEAQAEVLVTGGGLVIRQSGPRRCFPDRPVDYLIEVANPGQKDARDVRVSDVVPAGLEFVAAGDGGVFDAGTRQVSWQLPDLPAGQKHGLMVKLRARSTGDQVNRVLARTEGGEEVRADAVIQVGGLPALRLEVVGLDNQAEVGFETTYEIRVINQGSGPGTGVQVRATVPDGMQPLGADGPAAYRLQGSQLVFEPLAKLEPGREVRFRVRVRCQTPGDWRFRGELTSDQLQQPLCKEEGTRVYK